MSAGQVSSTDASAPASSANLDILRSIAVLTVMIDHLVPTLATHGVAVPGLVLRLTEHIGHAGVLAFFVHTSLVLMYSLERMASEPAGLVRRFYLRRAFRIYPLSIACVVAVLAFGIPEAVWRPSHHATPGEVVANLFLVQNLVSGHSVLAPLWSLPYEVEMYLVLPALFFLARRAGGARWICALLAAASVLGYVAARVDHGHMNMAAYLPCFLCGVLCYALRRRAWRRLPGVAWTPTVLALVAAFCVIHMHQGHPIYWVGWLFCLALALALLAFDDDRQPTLDRLAQRLATYSYGVYLVHVPVLYLVYSLWGPHAVWLGITVYVATTLVAARQLFHWLEAPMIELGRRLSSRRT